MTSLNRLFALLFLLMLSGSLFAEPSEAQKAEWRARREAAGGEAPSEAQRAEWRARREAREASAKADESKPTVVANEERIHPTSGKSAPVPELSHDHGAMGSRPAADKGAVKPEEAARPSGRPAGMGMRGGGGAIWLSDSPPSRGDGAGRGGMGGMMGMGGMAMGGERSGPPSKRLWMRAGSDPQKSGFAREDADAQNETLIVRPQGPLDGEALAPPADGKKNLAFEMPVQGYYRVYASSRKLQGETLNISVAKAEIANFSHGGDEEERAQALTAPRVLDSAPIEIVREKAADEKMFFQLKSGDEQAFVVLQKGLPLQGARVRFVSHEGWSKEAVSDEQGRVSFQVIRDYFPAWDDFKKRFKASYLIIAEANAAEKGVFKDQPYSNVRYQATLAGNYYPSPDDYRSYAWGLGIGLLIVLFSGTAVYLYRRRRVKPFQEVRFDDGR
ncbi:MAG: Nickel transport complex, NikM subunit, transrane [Proteobacteria bacterium]|nr:Nickel transport complex, NikM subunit, transrane [Pseudomonadota bacterium]